MMQTLSCAERASSFCVLSRRSKAGADPEPHDRCERLSRLPSNLRQVRLCGAAALSKLVSLSTRIEPLVTDLTNSIGSAEPGVAYAMLVALAGVLRNMPKAVRARPYHQRECWPVRCK